MTDKELLKLTDRCVSHLNDGGQPITMYMNADIINKLFNVNLSKNDVEELYKYLTKKTQLCKIYGSGSVSVGISICLTDFGLSVMRDFDSYSDYTRNKLYQRIWAKAESLMLVVTFLLVCIGALNDWVFAPDTKQTHGEQPQVKELQAKDHEEHGAHRPIRMNELANDSIGFQSISSGKNQE